MENLSVLVLDHDPVSLLTISNTLAKFNFKVLPFQTAAEALDSLERGVVKGEELDLVVVEVHPANTAMDTLVLFHHILDPLEVPFVTMCAYDDVEAVSERMTLGSCFNVVKPFGTETINILLHKAQQCKSRRVLPEGSSILKKIQGRTDSSSTKHHGSETEDDKEPDVFKAHGYSKKLHRFTWSSQLHKKFLQAVEVLGESATPRNILRHMNVKKNLTLDHVTSHLQKHRLREQRSKQVKEDYQKHSSMKKLSDLITSAQNAATPEPINHLTTTQMQITHGAASATRGKYPGKLWAQVEERSPEAKVLKTNTSTSTVPKRRAKSVWDKYEESLRYCDESPPKRLSMTYEQKFLPVKSKAIDEYGSIADIFPTAGGETGYDAPGRVNLGSLDLESVIRSRLEQLKKEISRAEAAANNVNLESVTLQTCYTKNQVHAAVNVQKDTMNQMQTAVAPHGKTTNRVHAAVNLHKDTMNQMHTAVAPHGKTMNRVHVAANIQKDTMNQVHTAVAPPEVFTNMVPASAMVADGVVDLGSNALLGGTDNNRSTAEKMPSDPFCSWEEVEGFWTSQLEEEQQGIEPDDLLQVDDTWNQALQAAIPANVDDAPVAQTGDAPGSAQEPAAGGALAYDPEFSIDDVQVWSPQFAGDDYGMPF